MFAVVLSSALVCLPSCLCWTLLSYIISSMAFLGVAGSLNTIHWLISGTIMLLQLYYAFCSEIFTSSFKLLTIELENARNNKIFCLQVKDASAAAFLYNLIWLTGLIVWILKPPVRYTEISIIYIRLGRFPGCPHSCLHCLVVVLSLHLSLNHFEYLYLFDTRLFCYEYCIQVWTSPVRGGWWMPSHSPFPSFRPDIIQ